MQQDPFALSSSATADRECTYCTDTATTLDHIPPRCLFPTPPPKNLITVQACGKCNTGASKDDEYFRSRLVLRSDVADDVSAQAALASVLRSLGRPQARGFGRSFRNDVGLVDRFTPEGVFIAPAPAFRVEPRLSSVPSRIVKGLMFHHTRQKLPPCYVVRAFPLEQIEYADETRRASLTSLLAPVVENAPMYQFGNVFRYWFAHLTEDVNASAWVMQFYMKALFVAFTGPEERVCEIERSARRQDL